MPCNVLSNNSGVPAILSEKDRKLKEQTDQLRIRRLLEVREESKKLARKLREDVAAEKARQLKKIQDLKESEQKCWKQRVMAEKCHDYQNAMYQVGQAHQAAIKENELMDELKRNAAERFAKFKKKYKFTPKSPCKTQTAVKPIKCTDEICATNKCKHRSTDKPLSDDEKPSTSGAQKSKRQICLESMQNEGYCGCCNQSNSPQQSPSKQKQAMHVTKSIDTNQALRKQSLEGMKSKGRCVCFDDENGQQPSGPSNNTDNNANQSSKPSSRNVSPSRWQPTLQNTCYEINPIHPFNCCNNMGNCNCYDWGSQNYMVKPQPSRIIPQQYCSEYQDKFCHYCCPSVLGNESAVSDDTSGNTPKPADCSCLNSSCNNTDVECIHDSKTKKKKKKKTQQLTQTPTVEEEICDCVSVTPPKEIKDKHIENNRQFTCVVCVCSKKTKKSPKKAPAPPIEPEKPAKKPRPPPFTRPIKKKIKRKNKETCTCQDLPGLPVCEQRGLGHSRLRVPTTPSKRLSSKLPHKSPKKTSLNTAIKSPTKKSENPCNICKSPVICPPSCSIVAAEDKPKETDGAVTTKPSKPHFTQITDLLLKYQPVIECDLEPLPEPESVKKSTPRLSSEKSKSPRSAHSNKSSKSQKSTETAILVPRLEDCDSVKFYDYKNKYEKKYPRPATVTRSNAKDDNALNAMERAEIEKKCRELREKEIELQNKRAEMRGQKALEREQIRRDCNELTEKLDALTRQQPPQLANDPKLVPGYRYAQRTKRMEREMNSAIEEILMRPVIITCPDVENQQQDCQPCASPSKKTGKPCDAGTLNIGAPPTEEQLQQGSSDSCCSMLLGYVNEQSQIIRNELDDCESQPNQNSRKLEKLRNLLLRVEQIRECLLRELNMKKDSLNAENVKRVIDSISSVRKERGEILIEDLQAPSQKSQKYQKQRELIERKLSELCETQKQKYRSSTNDQFVQTQDAKKMQETRELIEQKLHELCELHKEYALSNSDNLMQAQESKRLQEKCEMVQQKLQELCEMQNEQLLGETSDHIVRTHCTGKPVEIIIKVRDESRAPRKGQQEKRTLSKNLKRRLSPQLTASPVRTKTDLARRQIEPSQSQSSIDSNSTSYRSLPPALSTNADAYRAQRREDRAQIDDKMQKGIEKKKTIDPLVAYYVQRLLDMKRSSVQELCESSSDIQTPTSSIVNTPGNKDSKFENVRSEMEERAKKVCKFVEENRSFIEDLEKTLIERTMSVDTKMRTFDQLWKDCLGQKSKKKFVPMKTSSKEEMLRTEKQPQNDRTKKSSNKNAKSKDRPTESSTAQSTATRNAESRSPRKQFESTSSSETPVKRISAGEFKEPEPLVPAKLPTEQTKQRISELNEMINKVREEKQRLMEQTLSSVSDARNSTEYIDLVDEKACTSSSDATNSKLLDSGETLPSESAPLEKNKPIGISRDSGISMSRPVTAQGQITELDTQTTQQHRKSKPPPTTLRRYSPQLIEEEAGHELSTILEVDTPGTSKLGTSMQQHQQKRPKSPQPPIPFPKFEEYVRLHNLDISHLDPEQSTMVQNEFNELVQALADAQVFKEINYEAFPSFSEFLQNLTMDDRLSQNGSANDSTPETIEDLLNKLRLANVVIRSFPSHKDYMKQHPNSPEFDSTEIESPENTTNSHTTDSGTMNLEEEMRRRNLYIPRNSVNDNDKDKEKKHKDFQTYSVHEVKYDRSDPEKFSSPGNKSDDIERELFNVGIKWPAWMRRKTKETAALSSTSTSLELSKIAKHQRSHSVHLSFDAGRTLNLRDFLTKELLKHCTSSSSTSSENSLRSQFINSIIGLISASDTSLGGQTAAAGTSTERHLDRQKTSTPLFTGTGVSGSHNASRTGAGTTTSSSPLHLFSGESRLSSVHCQEQQHSVPTPHTKVSNEEELIRKLDEKKK